MNIKSPGADSASSMTAAGLSESLPKRSSSLHGPTLDTEALLGAWLQPVTKGTRRQYRLALRDLSGWMGEEEPDAIRRLLLLEEAQASLMLETWADARSQLALTTRRQRVGAVCSLLRYARAMGAGGPGAVRVRITGEVREPVTRASSVVAVRRALARLDSQALTGGKESLAALRDASIIALLASTGLRRAECAGIQLLNLDLGRGTLRVIRKGRRWEVLELPADVVRRLARWVERLPWDDGPLWGRIARCGGFIAGPGMHADSIARMTRKHGLGTPHDIRRMAGRWAVRQGGPGGSPADMESLRAFLGHRTLSATVRYTQSQGDGGARVREALSLALSTGDEEG